MIILQKTLLMKFKDNLMKFKTYKCLSIVRTVKVDMKQYFVEQIILFFFFFYKIEQDHCSAWWSGGDFQVHRQHVGGISAVVQEKSGEVFSDHLE